MVHVTISNFSLDISHHMVKSKRMSVATLIKGATDIRFAITMSKLELDMANHMVEFCVAF